MKSIITTIGLVLSLLVMSINNVFAENIYKTESMDEATKTLTVTICKGEEGKGLYYYKKNTIQYNDAGLEQEKTMYTWNGYEWEPLKKYNYEYDTTGQVEIISICNWDKSKKSWSKAETSQIDSNYKSSSYYLADKNAKSEKE